MACLSETLKRMNVKKLIPGLLGRVPWPHYLKVPGPHDVVTHIYSTSMQNTDYRDSSESSARHHSPITKNLMDDQSGAQQSLENEFCNFQ